MSKNNNIKIFNILILLVFLFICACSTKKYKPEPWCEDVFIPGSKYYEANIRHQQGYEIPPVLHAKDFIPKAMLDSDYYTIQDEVYSDGTIDHFRVKSRWGTAMAAGFVILKTRINEVNALESLDKVYTGESFLGGVWNAGVGIVLAPWNLLKLIGGLFVSDKKELTKEEKRDQKKLEKIKQKEIEYAKSLDTDGDGTPDVKEDDSDIYNERYARVIDEDTDFVEHLSYEHEETADVGTIQSIIGVDKNVVDILKKYNIDPDNTNPVLKDKVLHVARMEASGGLSTLALPAAPVLTVLSSTKSLVEISGAISAYQDEQAVLQQIHDGLLLAGCNGKLIKRFEENRGMSTFIKTILANATIEMKRVKGANEIIKFAMLVDDYELSWMLMQTIDVLRALNSQVKLKRFIVDSTLPTVVGEDGKVYMTFAGDHLYWVRDTAMYFDGALEAIREDGVVPNGQIEVRIAGIPSERFKQELNKRGLKYVIEKHMVHSIQLYNDNINEEDHGQF